MLKNKWILVLLILGLAGTAVYNITFFRSRYQGNTLASANTTLDVPTRLAEPVQNINTIGGTVRPLGSVTSEPPSRPLLFFEEIERQAGDPVDLSVKRVLPEGRPWPERDPFQAPRQRAPVPTRRVESAESPAKPSMETESTSSDPVFKVSAILIEENRRFALVNGYPKRIGASVGNWRIVAIEPDHVIVQTPAGERKVESLKPFENGKQIPNK